MAFLTRLRTGFAGFLYGVLARFLCRTDVGTFADPSGRIRLTYGRLLAGDAVVVPFEMRRVAGITFVERCHPGGACLGTVLVINVGVAAPAPSSEPLRSAPPMAAMIIFFTVLLFLSSQGYLAQVSLCCAGAR